MNIRLIILLIGLLISCADDKRIFEIPPADPDNGDPAGGLEVFADGFTGTELVNQMKDSKYRPMGLAQGPDGSLYISESKNEKIWRVIFSIDKLKFGKEALRQMGILKQKSYLRIADKELDLQPF